MSDVPARTVVAVASLASAVAVGWCAAQRRSGRAGFQEHCPDWRQLTPTGAVNAHVKEFGETELQATLVAKRLPVSAMRQRSQSFHQLMNTRRTMRFYSSDNVPQDVLETCLATAGTSPSGAHHQPWFFAVVRDGSVKLKIRELVEAEEKINYDRRMRKSWVQDLSSMTGATADPRLHDDSGAPQKPYLTEAPAIIAMFKQTHGTDAQGNRVDNYYVNESCGIAAGILITALHNVGLATLTSTPMGAEQRLRELLGRPENEKLFLLMPVGFPADDATVPYRTPLRKPIAELVSVL